MIQHIHLCDPPRQDLAEGQTWRCPECTQLWTVRLMWMRGAVVDTQGRALVLPPWRISPWP